MLGVVEFPQTFNPTQTQILRDAFVRAADQLRYGPDDDDERRQLALIILRLARLDGVHQSALIKEAVEIIKARQFISGVRSGLDRLEADRSQRPRRPLPCAR